MGGADTAERMRAHTLQLNSNSKKDAHAGRMPGALI
jgi:hypothetical protein